MDHNSLLFSNIIGQDKAKELLRRSASQSRLSHAYLFRGPSGVGKKTTAHAFAGLINCHSPKNFDEPCGVCPSCKKFRSGNHPDFMKVEADGAAIKIDQIRKLKHALTFPPFEAEHRVVLLADVHTMRREAANSLLKTLEEPPSNTILILTGDEASEILPTIVSRCQVVPFHVLPYDKISEALMAENELTPDHAFTLAAVAEGSLGRARLLLKRDLLRVRQEIIAQLLQFSHDQAESVEVVLALAENAAKLKEDLEELLELLRLWVKDLILQLSGISEKTINYDLAQHLQDAANRWSLQQLSDKLHLIQTAKSQLARNCNRALVCEVLFFGLL